MSLFNPPTPYRINDTSAYHRERMNTLGWELTVTNALEDPASPCRGILLKNDSFGNLLHTHLSAIISWGTVSSILEIGGGYGYLMRDLLTRNPSTRAAMLDLSPVLIDKQRETLKDFRVDFILRDFFEADRAFINQFDMVLLNEVAGDFPTLCTVDHRCLALPDSGLDPPLAKAKNFFAAYDLPVPPHAFNLNLGAIEAVEKLCEARVKYLYVSEHSSEAKVPDELKNKIRISGAGDPERIRLAGHDEYTVRFSHLRRVAERFGYRTVHGRYSDFIPFELNGRLNFILTSDSQREEHEIIRHFIEDLFKYEYMICIRREGEDAYPRLL